MSCIVKATVDIVVTSPTEFDCLVSFVLPLVNIDTTGRHLQASIGVGTSAFVQRPDVLHLLRYKRVCSECIWSYLSTFFSWYSSGSLTWSHTIIGAYRKLIIFIFVLIFLNFCTCCLLIYSLRAVIPILLLILPRFSLSKIVTTTAFLRYFISHVISFLLCDDVEDHVWYLKKKNTRKKTTLDCVPFNFHLDHRMFK